MNTAYLKGLKVQRTYVHLVFNNWEIVIQKTKNVSYFMIVSTLIIYVLTFYPLGSRNLKCG